MHVAPGSVGYGPAYDLLVEAVLWQGMVEQQDRLLYALDDWIEERERAQEPESAEPVEATGQASGQDESDHVELIALASRVRTRSVGLRGRWWRENRGPLVGRRNVHRPVPAAGAEKASIRESTEDPRHGVLAQRFRTPGIVVTDDIAEGHGHGRVRVRIVRKPGAGRGHVGDGPGRGAGQSRESRWSRQAVPEGLTRLLTQQPQEGDVSAARSWSGGFATVVVHSKGFPHVQQ
ncbi:hypothetical protein AB4225_37585 [Streptomyces sp. 2RAF24]|uniref:hypothetical protein n=1 Tax=Streptomyces sp. 2RAF24 TaxID=3232997 RepID=UPI003F99B086